MSGRWIYEWLAEEARAKDTAGGRDRLVFHRGLAAAVGTWSVDGCNHGGHLRGRRAGHSAPLPDLDGADRARRRARRHRLAPCAGSDLRRRRELNLLFDKWKLGPLRVINLLALMVFVIHYAPLLRRYVRESLPRNARCGVTRGVRRPSRHRAGRTRVSRLGPPRAAVVGRRRALRREPLRSCTSSRGSHRRSIAGALCADRMRAGPLRAVVR